MTMQEKLRIMDEIEEANSKRRKTNKRAKFLYAEHNRWMTILWYEYRGRDYTVNTALYTPTAVQHRMAQESIDAAIEREMKDAEYQATHPQRYEDTAEYGFEMFWKMVNE